MILRKRQRHQRGLTLVELLVAIAVGGLMIAGAIRIFISNKEAYTYNTALASIQAAGRVSMDMVLHDLRHAGHFGCSDSLDNVLNTTYSSSDVNNGTVARGSLPFMGVPNDRASEAADGQWIAMSLEGFDNADGTSVPSWSPSGGFAWAPTTADGRALMPLAGTDGVTVRYVQPAARYRTMANGGSTQTVVVSMPEKPASEAAGLSELGDRGLFEGGLAGVVHCRRAHLFEIDDIKLDLTGTAGLATLTASEPFETNVSYAEDNSAIVGRYVAVRYFVAGGRLDPGRPAGNTTMRIPTLYRERLVLNTTGAALEPLSEPLVEGVEDLQLLFAFDNQENAAGAVEINDGEPDAYLTATAVGSYVQADADPAQYPWINWMNVLSVRVAMLVRSADRVQRDPGLVGNDLTAEKARMATTFRALARFRAPTDATPPAVDFSCGGPAGADACRFSRRLLVSTAQVRNL